MEQKKKTNLGIICGALLVLIVIAYYSYLRSREIINSGVYVTAKVKKIRPAKNGWKANYQYQFKNKNYEFDGLIDWEYFSWKDNSSKIFFAKILDYKPDDGCSIVPTVRVPDSLQVAPPEGWSEDWMKEHFPEVVEYVHDTR